MNRRLHWNEVYQSSPPDDVSWYQPCPDLSLALIAATGAVRNAAIIDVGSGASTLTDYLLDTGYSSLAGVDISGAGLSHVCARLGQRGAAVKWFEADVTSFQPPHRFTVWHDRALFHFITEPPRAASTSPRFFAHCDPADT